MIPASFDYVRASGTEEAIGLLARPGTGTKLLAGGHSLIPLMKRRLVTPGLLVDIGHIDELRYIRLGGPQLMIGAMTCHAELEHDRLLAAEIPVLCQVAGMIGDPQVRRRGTIGGSLAHADPAADLPVALLALGADVVLRDTRGERVIPVGRYLSDSGRTAGTAEMITEIRVPRVPGGRGHFEKFSRRTCGWAIVAAAAMRDDTGARVAISGLGPVPVRATATERALAGGASVPDAADLADSGRAPAGDLHAGPRYRRHLARVLTRRALAAVRP